MPYIKRKIRNFIDKYGRMQDAGQLNYALSQVILAYLENKEESYQTYNDIIGALESLKAEIYRRKIAPYEDKKIRENGDIF